MTQSYKHRSLDRKSASRLAARSKQMADRTNSRQPWPIAANHTALCGAIELIHPKLKFGSPDDKYEREANSVAEIVVGPSNHIQLQNIAKRRDRLVQTHSAIPSVGQSENIPDSVKDVISSGRGRPLDKSTREFMETQFGGYDFKRVRVHTDSIAKESAYQLDAQAYTFGEHIAFAEEYQPQAMAGRKLLAHELAHVVQQQEQIEPNAIQRRPSNGTRGNKYRVREKQLKDFDRELNQTIGNIFSLYIDSLMLGAEKFELWHQERAKEAGLPDSVIPFSKALLHIGGIFFSPVAAIGKALVEYVAYESQVAKQNEMVRGDEIRGRTIDFAIEINDSEFRKNPAWIVMREDFFTYMEIFDDFQRGGIDTTMLERVGIPNQGSIGARNVFQELKEAYELQVRLERKRRAEKAVEFGKAMGEAHRPILEWHEISGMP